MPRQSSSQCFPVTLKLAAARALQRRSTSTHAESLIITENVRCQKKKKKALKKALNKHFQYSTFTHFFFFFVLKCICGLLQLRGNLCDRAPERLRLMDCSCLAGITVLHLTHTQYQVLLMPKVLS